MIEKKPFRLSKERNEDLKAIKYPLHLNQEDIQRLQLIGEIMQEEKMGTVIKNLMNIGITWVLNDPMGTLAFDTAFKKKRNNDRLGIINAKVDFTQKYNANF